MRKFNRENSSSARTDNERDTERRMKNELLLRLQDVLNGEDVIVVAATNRPFDIDPAARRRFEKRIYIPLPDEKSIVRLLEIELGNEPTTITKSDLVALAKLLDGYSGADIHTLVQDALMAPVRECIRATHWKRVLGPNGIEALTPCDPDYPSAIEMNLMDLDDPQKLVVPIVDKKHFQSAIEHVKPTVNNSELLIYEKFTEMFGQSGQVDPSEEYLNKYNQTDTPPPQKKEKEKVKPQPPIVLSLPPKSMESGRRAAAV